MRGPSTTTTTTTKLALDDWPFDVNGDLSPTKPKTQSTRGNRPVREGVRKGLFETEPELVSLAVTDTLANSEQQVPRKSNSWPEVTSWGKQALNSIGWTICATVAFSVAEVAYNYFFSTGNLETIHSINGIAWTSIASVAYYHFPSVRKMVVMTSIFFFAVEKWLSKEGVLPAPWQTVASAGMLLAQGFKELPNETKGILVAGSVVLYGLAQTSFKDTVLQALGCCGRARRVWRAASENISALWNGVLSPGFTWVCRRVF